MPVSFACPHNRARTLTRTLAAGLAALAGAGLFLAAPAQASTGQAPSPAAGAPTTAIRPPTVTGSPSATAPKECFYVLPKCASSDPTAGFTIVSQGDTTGCTFHTLVLWGDHKREAKTYPGGADGSTLASFDHTYASDPKFYTVTVKGKTTVGSCGSFSGPLQFMHMCSPPAAGSLISPADTTLDNWAGYIARSSPVGTDCTFTSVTGTWVQPKVTCPKTNKGNLEADFWVGLDGSDSNTVEQTGVEVTCLWNTATGTYTGPTYEAWYEMFSDNPVFTGGGYGSLHPLPGRTVTATVTYNPNATRNPYSLKLTVTASGQTQTGHVQQACLNAKNRACRNVNAEWLTEKVDGRALASFTPWKVTNGFATTSADSAQQSVAALNSDPTDVIVGTKTLAFACNLSGSGFTVQRAAC